MGLLLFLYMKPVLKRVAFCIAALEAAPRTRVKLSALVNNPSRGMIKKLEVVFGLRSPRVSKDHKTKCWDIHAGTRST